MTKTFKLSVHQHEALLRFYWDAYTKPVQVRHQTRYWLWRAGLVYSLPLKDPATGKTRQAMNLTRIGRTLVERHLLDQHREPIHTARDFFAARSGKLTFTVDTDA